MEIITLAFLLAMFALFICLNLKGGKDGGRSKFFGIFAGLLLISICIMLLVGGMNIPSGSYSSTEIISNVSGNYTLSNSTTTYTNVLYGDPFLAAIIVFFLGIGLFLFISSAFAIFD